MQQPEFYLLRHGLTHASIDGLTAGRFDTDVAPKGLAEAALAGDFLRTLGLKKIFASPQKRVKQTLAAMKLNTPVISDDRLMEMHFGIYEGRPSILKNQDNVALRDMVKNKTLHYPGGENYSDVEARLKSFIEETLSHEEEPILVAGHGTTGKILLMTLFPERVEEILPTPFKTCEVFKIENGNYEKVFSPLCAEQEPS